jgi:hypothetical protein
MSFISGLFGAKAPKPMAYIPPPDRETKQKELDAAAADYRRKEQAKSGKQSTIMTAGQGLIEEAQTQQKTVLGA